MAYTTHYSPNAESYKMELCNSNSLFLYNGGLTFTCEPVSHNGQIRSQRAAQVTPVVFATSGTFPCRIASDFTISLIFCQYIIALMARLQIHPRHKR